MTTALTVLAGLVLAGAATAGVVVSQPDAPTGTPAGEISLVDEVSGEEAAAVYDVGQ